ncbi:MAG: hypothetical protein KIT22_05340, partial [Verrucomicrobiae bacterium]|nr:hypothetical protein [Verrucomicrobiae bacterium]
GDVERFNLSFYDGSRWRTYWDSTNETTLVPKAVKVELFLAEPEEDTPGRGVVSQQNRVPVQLVVPIAVLPATNSTSTTSTNSTTQGGTQ